MRTTRCTTLTREGELFYENCSGPPQGHLRVRAPIGFGRKVVAPLLSSFHRTHPAITLDVQLDDRPADFTTDGVDVAFRDGRMEDSQVVARQVIPMQLLLCASPGYASQHGLPKSVADVALHRCINVSTGGRASPWEFKVEGRSNMLTPPSRQSFNDAELVLDAVLRGEGIAQLPAFQIRDRLRAMRPTIGVITCAI